MRIDVNPHGFPPPEQANTGEHPEYTMAKSAGGPFKKRRDQESSVLDGVQTRSRNSIYIMRGADGVKSVNSKLPPRALCRSALILGLLYPRVALRKAAKNGPVHLII